MIGTRSFHNANLHLSLPPFERLEIGDYAFQNGDKIELGELDVVEMVIVQFPSYPWIS